MDDIIIPTMVTGLVLSVAGNITLLIMIWILLTQGQAPSPGPKNPLLKTFRKEAEKKKPKVFDDEALWKREQDEKNRKTV